MANSKLEIDIVMKSSAEKVWKNLKDFATTFPNALPQTYEKIEIIEGDGKSVGSVLKATLKLESRDAASRTTKERIDLVDEEKKTMSYSFIEADMLNHYKNFKATVCVVDGTKGTDGSVVKYSAVFEKANEQIPDPIPYKDFAVKLFHDFDAYLMVNSSA